MSEDIDLKELLELAEFDEWSRTWLGLNSISSAFLQFAQLNFESLYKTFRKKKKNFFFWKTFSTFNCEWLVNVSRIILISLRIVFGFSSSSLKILSEIFSSAFRIPPQSFSNNL